MIVILKEVRTSLRAVTRRARGKGEQAGWLHVRLCGIQG